MAKYRHGKGVVGQDITAEFRQWAVLLDRDAVYRELVEWKRTQRWWNFSFDRHAIDSALACQKYEVLGMSGMLSVREPADLVRLQRLAVTLVRRLFEAAYRKKRKPGQSVCAGCGKKQRHS